MIVTMLKSNSHPLSPIAQGTSQASSSVRNDKDLSWSPPRFVKTLVSTMARSPPSKLSRVFSSPSSAKISEASSSSLGSPSGRTGSRATKMNRGVSDTTKDEISTSLSGIEEENSVSSMDAILTKLSSASNIGPLTTRRGYRPLSVRMGQALNPFSPKATKPDRSDLAQGEAGELENEIHYLSKGPLELKKLRSPEDPSPHNGHTSSTTALTSKSESDSSRQKCTLTDSHSYSTSKEPSSF
jgi:hypothetical protein